MGVNGARGDRQDDAPATALDAARAVGVVFGGPVLLLAGAATALASVLRSLAVRRRPRPVPMLGALGAVAYARHVVPWMRRWGATDAEALGPLPGDAFVTDPAIASTRAVTIDAPVAEVWPWLAQIGQERGGFYSYAWLENLAGCRLRNAERIHPEWQRREVGETMMLHPAHGLPITIFEPGRAFGIEGWGVYALAPAAGATTRLLARSRIPRGAPAVFYALLVEVPHFVMERRMMLGIKERAERVAADRGVVRSALP